MNKELEAMKKRMWSKRVDNHLFIFWNGVPIYKNYDLGEPSVIFDKKGYPNWRIES